MSDIVKEELDKLYLADKSKYETEVNTLKGIGYKIYRNSAGEHKVIDSPKKQDDIYSAFSGIFGDIFKGGV